MKKGGTIAMQERKSIIRWIRNHKAELIIAGFSIGTLILIVMGLKNQQELKELWNLLKENKQQPAISATETVTLLAVEIPQDSFRESITASESLPFEVSRHIRELHEGWHASPEKIASALENDIVLKEGQTWVESYLKGGASA